MNIFIPFYALSTLPTQAIYVSGPESSVHHKTQHYYYSRHYSTFRVYLEGFRIVGFCQNSNYSILLKTKLHRFVNHIVKYIKLILILTIRIEQQTRVVREKTWRKLSTFGFSRKAKFLIVVMYCIRFCIVAKLRRIY